MVSPNKDAEVSEMIRYVNTTNGTLVCFVAKCDNGAVRFGMLGRFVTSLSANYLSLAEGANKLSEGDFIYMCKRVIYE